MHLAPRDLDKLLVHQAGFVAQKRLARGVRLNYPESVALLANVLLELIRDGRSVSELMSLGRRILGRREVLPGVPELLHSVQVEGTFPDGTKLVTVHEPISQREGDFALSLYGSHLPTPDAALFPEPGFADLPGQLTVGEGNVLLNDGLAAFDLEVQNRGDRPIQVGSHYPFDETNAALSFDRALARGARLDIPAGTAVRFEPGQARTVRLVKIHAGGAS